tara:strand:- start:18325 stop:19632 length:1308 start_codon:yes stop_codon:yes gene_type:complete
LFKYVLKKISYGFLVLLGVITIIFTIYSFKPGAPAALSGGQNTNEDIVENFNREWGLNENVFIRYIHFVNDISPLSFHNIQDKSSYYFYNKNKYNGSILFKIGNNFGLIIKSPYLKKSYINNRNVSELIFEKLFSTSILAFFAIFLASFLGVFLGVLSAFRVNGFIDKFTIIFSIAGMSAPSFFMASIISVIGGYYWSKIIYFPILPLVFSLLFIVISLYKSFKDKAHLYNWKKHFKSSLKGFLIGLGVWILLVAVKSVFLLDFYDAFLGSFHFPGTGLDPSGSIIEINEITGLNKFNWSHLVLPCITLSLRPLAIISILTKKSMEDVLKSDFIRTARSKGLNPISILWKHALRNAINPVVTAISGWFASLLSGAVFVEMIFNWDGIGLVLVNALKNDDLPVVMGITLIISIIFVVINLIVDVLYSIIDPRVVLK